MIHGYRITFHNCNKFDKKDTTHSCLECISNVTVRIIYRGQERFALLRSYHNERQLEIVQEKTNRIFSTFASYASAMCADIVHVLDGERRKVAIKSGWYYTQLALELDTKEIVWVRAEQLYGMTCLDFLKKFSIRSHSIMHPPFGFLRTISHSSETSSCLSVDSEKIQSPSSPTSSAITTQQHSLFTDSEEIQTLSSPSTASSATALQQLQQQQPTTVLERKTTISDLTENELKDIVSKSTQLPSPLQSLIDLAPRVQLVSKKPNNSHTLRREVWNFYHKDPDSALSECYFCAAPIRHDNWTMAHKFNWQDPYAIDNLAPSCKPCNDSMGQQNAVEWALPRRNIKSRFWKDIEQSAILLNRIVIDHKLRDMICQKQEQQQQLQSIL